MNAIDINSEVTSVSHSTGVDTNGDNFFVAVANSVSKRLEKGNKTQEGNTAIAQSEILPWDETSLCDDHPSGETGGKLFYLSSSAVSTLENGDQIYSELDPGMESYFCSRGGEDENNVVLYRIFNGGTGEFEEACGYTKFVGTVRRLDGGLSAIKGLVTGEIFNSATVSPGAVYGCP